jgi:AmmeMemoRadiSam system protein B
MQKPRLRPVRGFPVQHEGQTAMGLADAQQISQKVVFTMPAAQMILPHMTGEKTLDEIVSAIGQGLTRPMLEQFVAQLDDAGLIEGPNFDTILAEVRAEYDSLDHLPPAMTAVVADMLVKHAAQQAGETDEPSREMMDQMGPGALREQLNTWMDQTLKEAEEPSFDALPKAVVTPHIDYFRGWPNYAHVYGRMRVVDRPDRVIILGTNHFGRATGVTGCDKGFETPLGLSPLDEEFVALLQRNLGDENTERLFEHRYDHEREHSIECQVPWLQHVFGEGDAFPKVFGAMVHDPTHTGGESYDGKGLGLQPFVEALRAAIESSPGRTLIVCSADLSHVGAQFGDKIQLTAETNEAKQAREKVIRHDREMLNLFAEGKPEEIVSQMAWQQNPTRWCSLGAMTATWQAVSPGEVKMLSYHGAMDQQGTALVTSCAAAIF